MKTGAAICLAVTTGLICSTAAGVAAGDTSVYVNGKRLDTEAILQNDRTYVPLRAVSEAMGAQVSWDGDTQSAYVNFSEDDALPKLIEDVSPSVVAIVGNYKPEYMSQSASKYNERMAHGAGVIIKSNGTVLTNAHVVEEIQNITVLLSDGTSYPGRVDKIDKESDLAVVKIEKLGLKPIKMGRKEDIQVGRTVIAIGTPISLEMRNSATKGIISGSNVRVDSFYRLIQTDAAINPGNSGGPLINVKGELVGINSSKYVAMGIEGMAFSIPVDTVDYVLGQFEKYGEVRRPSVGVTFEESWEARAGLFTDKGLTVKTVKDSMCGLQQGDEIKAVNGIEIHSIVDWNEAIKRTYTDGSISAEVVRGGSRQTIEVNPA